MLAGRNAGKLIGALHKVTGFEAILALPNALASVRIAIALVAVVSRSYGTWRNSLGRAERNSEMTTHWPEIGSCRKSDMQGLLMGVAERGHGSIL